MCVGKEEEQELEATLNYMMSLRPVYILMRPFLKRRKERGRRRGRVQRDRREAGDLFAQWGKAEVMRTRT